MADDRPDKHFESPPLDEAATLVRRITENAALGLAADQQSADEASALLSQALVESALAVNLREAVELAAARSTESMKALRTAVCAFTIALRDEGVTPEAVLIRLKFAIRTDTLGPTWATSTWSPPHLHNTITTWCIKDYFSEAGCAE